MKRLPAFSLVEIAIGLFILGLLLTAVMKGSQLIDSAKLQTFVHQIMDIQLDFDKWFDDQDEMPDIRNYPLPKERPKLGGKFQIETESGKAFVLLTGTLGSGFLSPAHIKEIQKYFPETTAVGCDMNTDQKTCRVSIALN